MITKLTVNGPSNGATRDLQGDYAVCGCIDDSKRVVIAQFFNQVDYEIFLDAKSSAELFKQALLTAKLAEE